MKLLLSLMVLAILSMMLIPVFAQRDIVFTTDKLEYSNGEIIFINGTIANYDSQNIREFTFYVYVHDERLVYFESMTVNLDGSFEKTLVVDEPVFVLTGDYMLIFEYGSDSEGESIKYLDGVSELIPHEFILTTDKPGYHKDETVFISGEVPIFDGNHDIHIDIISPLERRIGFTHTTSVNFDRTFNYSFPISNISSPDIGIYTIRASYISEQIETTFELLPPYIQVFTDKPSYNEIETISITGKITGLTISPTDNIAITLYDTDNRIFLPEMLTTITDDSFSFQVLTDDVMWQNYNDYITIYASIQNHTAQTTIHYSYYPAELSLEFLHDNVTDNTYIINDMYTTHDTLINLLAENIILLENKIDELQRILDEIREIPSIADAPIITDVYYFDVDSNEEYSNGDMISILFDSNTNSAGGRLANKIEVDNMFTFTESLGTIYRGTWQSPTTFIITVNNINNAGPPVMGITTVTPTGIIPILSVDETSLPSTITSPVITIEDKAMFKSLFN